MYYIHTIKEQNANKDIKPLLVLFCIDLTSGGNKTLAIKFGMVCTPQLAAKVEVDTKRMLSQDKNVDHSGFSSTR